MEQNTTLFALILAAFLDGLIHTIAGPDHYLPFVALSKSRNYGWFKTILWTILCGIGHVGSAFLLAAGFLFAANLLSEAQFEWLETWRGDIAAYALIGMGAAVILHALHRRWKHRAEQQHPHNHNSGQLSYWVIFIIFVLGPCEALLPLLTASAVLGLASVLLVTLVFTATTLLTMLGAVLICRYGLEKFRLPWLEKYAAELAGATVMLCGIAICLGL
ncbi:MAG: hypothetical protein J6C30_03250 [Lentisphaeria bacterium]|nr:hypothetical protein [Lentisphaeria bacterium]